MALYIGNKNWIIRANNQSYATKYFSEAPQKFTIEDKTYLFKMGMTWAEWVESEYNTDDYFEWNGEVRIGDLDWIVDNAKNEVKTTDLIALGAAYGVKEAGLPAEYTQYESIQTPPSGAAYIDLGFAFDTAATIKMRYDALYDVSFNLVSNGYPFGAADSTGAYRCMISETDTNDAAVIYGYGFTGSAYQAVPISWTNPRRDLTYTLKNGNVVLTETFNNQSAKYSSGIAYTMTDNMYLNAQNYKGEVRGGGAAFVWYSFAYYDKNDHLICKLVPSKNKASGKIGMYDIIRKQFLISIGTVDFRGTPFAPDDIRNEVRYSTEADGVTIYNNGIGYKYAYRVRSGGAEQTSNQGVCTGYIPFTKGEKLYIYPAFTGLNSQNAINFSDNTYTNLGQITDSDARYGICANSGGAGYKSTVINGLSVLDISSVTEANVDKIAFVRITNDTNISTGADMIISKTPFEL